LQTLQGSWSSAGLHNWISRKQEKALSNEEREAAIQFLEWKDLPQRTNELIGESGVIGVNSCDVDHTCDG